MKIDRAWATPLTIGAFGLSAVTGVLMFFHADVGLNKAAHEWVGWVLVVAVAVHAASNFGAFKRHFGSAMGKGLIASFALLLAVSFVPLGDKKDGSPVVAPARALAKAPIATLADVAQVSQEEMMSRLRAQGVQPASPGQSLGELVGKDLHRQIEVLARVLKTAE